MTTTSSITQLSRDQVSQDADLAPFAQSVLEESDDTDILFKFQAHLSNDEELILRIVKDPTVIIKDEEGMLSFWNYDDWYALVNIPLSPESVEIFYPGAIAALNKHHDQLLSEMRDDGSFEEILNVSIPSFNRQKFDSAGMFFVDSQGLHHVCYDKKNEYYEFFSTAIYWQMGGYWEVN